jgi:cytochrome c oxidase cbb3-type subunit I/II
MSTPTDQAKVRIQYDDELVKKFLLATVFWAFVALLLGVYIALELAFWRANLGVPQLTFGRLRPLHTNAAIFAFAGNAIFTGIYYSTQRLLKTRLYSDLLGRLHFWGWQCIIVLAAITLPMGYTVSKEYAELEWPIKILITVVWVIFGVNFFGTIKRRREQHMYVAIWFYIATVITVAALHIFNSINVPVSFLKSYPVYAGAQDALVQWWYGHNAVAFFLTTPFLGLMYYFVPKAAERPIYSYRLSIIHFWGLVFLYIWAGPHHLLFTALPEWSQTLGMIFSLMLWAPSWGGMINGLLTLRGAWDKLRTDYVLRFLVTGVTFYAMATFEGPMLSIKAINSLAHFTDWIIGHVHTGTIGWNGMLTFGMIYYLVPRLWKTDLYSPRLAMLHFWCGTIGVLIYMVSMWGAGVTQGLMLRGMDETGKLLYPEFIETVVRIIPLYWSRFSGGVLYLSGVVMMVVNVWQTIRKAPVQAPEDVLVPAGLNEASHDFTKPHRVLEGLPAVFTVLTGLAVSVGSLIEIIPLFFVSELVTPDPVIKPYTALQIAGRDLYIREGCYLCHSQHVRPMEHEVLRFGPVSRLEESKYDHPFQWGSRRIGPDLARLAGKYPDMWHYRHMLDPRSVTAGSIMPPYPWLFRFKIDFEVLPRKLAIMRRLGVPYTDLEIEHASSSARLEAAMIASGMVKDGVPEQSENLEIMALISYLQRLGKDWVDHGAKP